MALPIINHAQSIKATNGLGQNTCQLTAIHAKTVKSNNNTVQMCKAGKCSTVAVNDGFSPTISLLNAIQNGLNHSTAIEAR
jgi:hypothetical protein